MQTKSQYSFPRLVLPNPPRGAAPYLLIVIPTSICKVSLSSDLPSSPHLLDALQRPVAFTGSLHEVAVSFPPTSPFPCPSRPSGSCYRPTRQALPRRRRPLRGTLPHTSRLAPSHPLVHRSQTKIYIPMHTYISPLACLVPTLRTLSALNKGCGLSRITCVT